MKKIVFLLVLVATVFVTGACKSPKVGTKNDAQKDVDYALSVVSAIKEKEECYICGDNEHSMMDYYRKSGMMGLVCLNTMDITNLDARMYSDDGTQVLEPEHDGGSMHNTYDDGKVKVNINGMEYRGIFKADITYGKDSKVDFEKTKGFLCQDCLDKVTAMYEDCMEWTDGEGRFPQICLIDFSTNELYSLASHQLGYSIRDFWVHIDHGDDADSVMAIYAPKGKMG